MQVPLYCPCVEEHDQALERGRALFQQAGNLKEFVRLMNEQQVKGRWLCYDSTIGRLTIAKRYGCECEREGQACRACSPGDKCHCDQVRHLRSARPLAHCQCGAEYYRPLFEGIFGVPLTLYPLKTVLSGDKRCVIALELPDDLVKE